MLQEKRNRKSKDEIQQFQANVPACLPDLEACGIWSFKGFESPRDSLLQADDKWLGSWFRENILLSPEWEAQEERTQKGKKRPRGSSKSAEFVKPRLSFLSQAVYAHLKNSNNDPNYAELEKLFREKYPLPKFRSITPNVLTAFVFETISPSDFYSLKKPLEDTKYFYDTYIVGRYRRKNKKDQDMLIGIGKFIVDFQFFLRISDKPEEQRFIVFPTVDLTPYNFVKEIET